MAATTPATSPALAVTRLPETMNHVVVVLGDTSINAFETSGLLAANDNICVVLASTERATIEALDGPAGSAAGSLTGSSLLTSSPPRRTSPRYRTSCCPG